MEQTMKGFVIDTDTYSGHFEHEMCAFLTGHFSVIEILRDKLIDYTSKYTSESDPLPNVSHVTINGDYPTPVSLYPTPGVWRIGESFHYEDGEEAEALEKYKENTKSLLEAGIELAESVGYSNEYIHSLKSRIREVQEMKMPDKKPGYQSILIHFSIKPSDDVISLLKRRANAFASLEGFETTGFRLIGFE